MVEIVLNDGRFARFSNPTLGDLIACYDDNSLRLLLRMAERIVFIDGDRYSLEDWERMELEAAMPVISYLSSLIQRALSLKGVA